MQCELICTEKQNRKTEMGGAGGEVNACCNESLSYIFNHKKGR